MLHFKTLLLLACSLLLFASTARISAVESCFAKFGDVKVHYLDRGKGDEALVFVHGWTCNADFWRPQLKDDKLKAEVRTAMLATPDYVGISAMEGMADEKIYLTDKVN